MSSFHTLISLGQAWNHWALRKLALRRCKTRLRGVGWLKVGSAKHGRGMAVGRDGWTGWLADPTGMSIWGYLGSMSMDLFVYSTLFKWVWFVPQAGKINWHTNVYRCDHFQLDTPPSRHLNTEVLGRCWDWVLSKQILKMNVLLIVYIDTLRDHGDEHPLIYIILRPAVSSGLGRVAFRGGWLTPKNERLDTPKAEGLIGKGDSFFSYRVWRNQFCAQKFVLWVDVCFLKKTVWGILGVHPGRLT